MFFKYLWYVIRHKWYVMIECFKRGYIWRGITHDLSKFLPDEFFPYMFYFYGNEKQQMNWKNKYRIAWLKHQKRNKHHWQYWILISDSWQQTDPAKIDSIEMPEKYMYEMLCDWIVAGKAIHGKNDLEEWYKKNQDNIILHSGNKIYLNHLILGNPRLSKYKERNK